MPSLRHLLNYRYIVIISIIIILSIKIELKGMHLDNEFYVVVGIQCRTENA